MPTTKKTKKRRSAASAKRSAATRREPARSAPKTRVESWDIVYDAPNPPTAAEKRAHRKNPYLPLPGQARVGLAIGHAVAGALAPLVDDAVARAMVEVRAALADAFTNVANALRGSR